jgi:SM-20-related protein
MEMRHIQIGRLETTSVDPNPFDHVIVPSFLGPETVHAVNDTFPNIKSCGSHILKNYGPRATISDVIAELDGPEFEEAIENKFNISLSPYPKLYSLRAHTRAKDGRIHTDSKDKIVTVLLYLNRDWPFASGRLRLLRSGTSLEDYVAEISPDNGTLLAFKRSDTSWHGHLPFVGPRRALQMNWVSDCRRSYWHVLRHTVSAVGKRFAG